MDVIITNHSGYTTVNIKGHEVHIRQTRKDFLKDNFNIILKSIHQKNNIVNDITHCKSKMHPRQEIGAYKWEQHTGKTIEKSGEYK